MIDLSGLHSEIELFPPANLDVQIEILYNTEMCTNNPGKH